MFTAQQVDNFTEAELVEKVKTYEEGIRHICIAIICLLAVLSLSEILLLFLVIRHHPSISPSK